MMKQKKWLRPHKPFWLVCNKERGGEKRTTLTSKRGVTNGNEWVRGAKFSSFPLLFKGDIISIINEHQRPVRESLWLICPMSSVHSSSSFLFFPFLSLSLLPSQLELSVSVSLQTSAVGPRVKVLVLCNLHSHSHSCIDTCTNPEGP